MISETDINTEKPSIMEINEEMEKNEKDCAEVVQNQPNDNESTFNEEEYSVLKEKVEKLEGLLTNCRGTIVNNKEKVKRLSEDKEGIQHRLESQLDLIRNQCEEEMNSKFCGMQEQIQGLTEEKDRLRGELDDMINLQGEDLIKKMRSDHRIELEGYHDQIKSLHSELSQLKTTSNTQQSNTSNTGSSPPDNTNEATVKVEPEEHKKLMKQLEGRSEELIAVMEERSNLRKELNSQRERFTLVLERYDSQMKVVQEELRLRMMPGPEEESMGKQVVSLMAGDVTAEEEEVVVSSSGMEDQTVTSGTDAEKLSVKDEEEGVKVVKMLGLLERCARKADEKAAECTRWCSRFNELSEKHKSSASEAAENVEKLEKEVIELRTKDAQMSEELDKTRTENGDMLRAQRSEMGDLQKVVDRLIANEDFLKTQMNDIKKQCDDEVARANKQNEGEMNKLKAMLDENKCAVGELFEQLTLSKTKSNEMVKELEQELDYRYRQLDAARTYINSLKESKTPPADPTLEAIFSNMPNFIYVDDVVNGDKESEKKDGEKIEGDKKEKDGSGNEKVKNNAEKNKKNNSKPVKSNKK